MTSLMPLRLRDLVVAALEDQKGRDILVLDVTSLTDITDFMIIVSGTSNRHVKALVDQVVDTAKVQQTHRWAWRDGKRTSGCFWTSETCWCTSCKWLPESSMR